MSIIIGNVRLVKDVLKDKPLFGDPEKRHRDLRNELGELDKTLRIWKYDLDHVTLTETHELKKQFAKVNREYSKKSEESGKLGFYLETRRNFGTFNGLCNEKQIYVHVGAGYGSADIYQQRQILKDDLKFSLQFHCCGAQCSFNLLDMLSTTSLLTLVSNKSTVGLGILSCPKGCKKNSTLWVHVSRI